MSNQLIEFIKSHKSYLIEEVARIEEHELTSESYSKEYVQGAIACLDYILSMEGSLYNV